MTYTSATGLRIRDTSSDIAPTGICTEAPRRNYAIDVLRTTAMLLVVILHIAAPYATKGLYLQVYEVSFWTGNIVNSLSRICVPLFVMISGSFLLGREESYASFYKKRAARILWPLIVWVAIYALYELGKGYLLYDKLNLVPVTKSLFAGGPFYHLWYLYMLIGLYLVTPALNKALQGLNMEEIRRAAVVLLITGCVIDLTNFYYGNSIVFLIWFIEYLGYFLMGYVMINSSAKSNQIGLLAVYLLSSLLIAGLTYFSKGTYFYNYTSPLVILASLAIYKLFTQATLGRNFLAKVSKLTFGVYLVHAMVLNVVEIIEKRAGLTTGVVLLDIFVKVILVLTVSLVLATLISRMPKLNKVI